MIGQSGPPMMNDLAGSKKEMPEDAKAQSVAAEAGAFEKVLSPEAQSMTGVSNSETQANEQLKVLQESTLAGAGTADNAIIQTQAESAAGIAAQVSQSNGGESQVEPQPNQLFVGSIEEQTRTLQSQDSSGQSLRPTSGNNTAEAQTFPIVSSDLDAADPNTLPEVSPNEPNLQTDKLETKATSLENSTEKVAHVLQDQAGNTPPQNGIGANDQLASASTEAPNIGLPPDSTKSPIDATLAGTPGAIQAADGAAVQRSQQASLLAERGSEAVAALQSKSSANSDTMNLNATAKAAERAGQAEAEKTASPPSQSFGELRSIASVPGGLSAPDPGSTLQNAYSVNTDADRLKSLMPVMQNQTVTSETLISAQSATFDPSELTLGPSTATVSLASSRFDAPSIAPMATTADAKLVVQQINQAIIRMDGTRTEVILDPVELGRVSLTFITKDEGVTVLINADRSETTDLLRRNGEQLQRDLSDAGYEGVDLEFSPDDDAHPENSATDAFDDNGSTQSLSVSYDANFATSGLDIRI